jgi:hypothetical protein
LSVSQRAVSILARQPLKRVRGRRIGAATGRSSSCLDVCAYWVVEQESQHLKIQPRSVAQFVLYPVGSGAYDRANSSTGWRDPAVVANRQRREMTRLTGSE